MIRGSYLNENFLTERLLESEKERSKKVKDELYDVCYHCHRVVENGSLLNHLKSKCSPRRNRVLLMKNKDEGQHIDYHPVTEQLIRNPEENEEEITVPSIKSFKHINDQTSNHTDHSHDFRHKIFSPWTLELPKHIRDHIKPTREIIISEK